MIIKFLSKTPVEKLPPLWNSLRPAGGFKGITFTFDPDARDYDFLVIYEDLPPLSGDKKILRSEKLACPRSNTMLITTEPGSIRLAGPHYLGQFGTVWSSVPYRKLYTPNRATILRRGYEKGFRGAFYKESYLDYMKARLKGDVHGIYSFGLTEAMGSVSLQESLQPPPLRWFYGRDMAGNNHRSLKSISRNKPTKSLDLSTVTSNKQMAHTGHATRYDFIRGLKSHLGDSFHIFGKGHSPVDDKAEGMDAFRYHIALENHVQSGHHTEKLNDCFLAGCLPFYCGDPDYDKVYPKDAVIPIDMRDVKGSVKIIKRAVETDQYKKRLEALKEAKRIALSVSNPLIASINWARTRASHNWRRTPQTHRWEDGVIHGRHAFRRRQPGLALKDAAIVRQTKKYQQDLLSPLQFHNKNSGVSDN